MRFKAINAKNYRTIADLDELSGGECKTLYEYIHGFALSHKMEVDIKITPDELAGEPAGDIVDEI